MKYGILKLCKILSDRVEAEMYYFIINPASRSGYGYLVWKRVEKHLIRLSEEYEAYLTEGPGQASQYARTLTEHCGESRVLVVIGGDGTMNEVLDGMNLSSFVTLGYIPAGWGSDLAAGLRLSHFPVRGLCRILNPRSVRQLDYGVITYGDDVLKHRRFVVSAGMGLDGAVCHRLLYSRIRGFFNRLHMHKIPYVVTGFLQCLKTRPVKGYILLDGTKRVEFNNIYFVSVQLQSSEGGGFRFAPRADCSDGSLDVCVVSHSSRRQVFGILWRAYWKRSHNRGIRSYSCREVQIHTERPLAVHVDGESCQYQSDIDIRCIERKVSMIV